MGLRPVTVLHPEYYERFCCIGGACEDDCCREWKIVIDKAAYTRYKKVRDPDFAKTLPERIKRLRGEAASDRHYAEFVLNGQSNCPYHLPGGLCEIQLRLGEKYLCTTCRTYPRRAARVMPDLLELSLTMSCPEAVRVALFDHRPMSFVLSQKELAADDPILRMGAARPDPDGHCGLLAAHAWAVRKGCIDLMLCRKLSLPARIMAIGMLLKRLCELAEAGQAERIPAAVGTHVAAAEEGRMKELFAAFPENEEVRVAMASILIRVCVANAGNKTAESGPFRAPFEGYLRQSGARESLSFGKDFESDLEIHRFVERQAERHWDAFVEQYGHVLENYLVNHIFTSVFPFCFQKDIGPYHHFIILAEQYALLRMLLCAGASDEEGVTEPQLVRTICAMASKSLHARQPLEILEQYQQAECDSLGHVAFMLKG